MGTDLSSQSPDEGAWIEVDPGLVLPLCAWRKHLEEIESLIQGGTGDTLFGEHQQIGTFAGAGTQPDSIVAQFRFGSRAQDALYLLNAQTKKHTGIVYQRYDGNFSSI